MKQDYPVFFKRYLELHALFHTPHFIDLTYGLLRLFWSRGLLDDISELDIPFIAFAAGLHDLGRSVLAPSIANPTGALTPAEQQVFETHTVLGAAMLSAIELPHFMDSRIYQYGWEICLQHHERWDGRGYPQHLKGDKIAPYIQVVSLADGYDEMRAPHPGCGSFSHKKALEMISSGRRGTFSPQILDCFLSIMNEENAAFFYSQKQASQSNCQTSSVEEPTS